MVVVKPKILCPKCSKEYISKTWYDKHVVKCGNIVSNQIKKNRINVKKKLPETAVIGFDEIITGDLLPTVFNFDDDYFKDQSINISYPNYLNFLNDFCESHIGEVKVLHLNINSLFLKCYEFKQIVELGIFDIISLNETKLDETIPNNFFWSEQYRIIRRDKVKNGGGVLVLIKKNIVIVSSQNSTDFEAIALKIKCNESECNVLCCYKSPNQNSKEFLEFIENYLLSINMTDPFFVVGDLNLDIIRDQPFAEFLDNFNLRTLCSNPTRIRIKNNNAVTMSTIDHILTKKNV